MEDKSELTDIKTIQANIFGDVCLRKQRRKRQKLLIIELLYDFARNTTLHGLRNIIDTKLSIIERIFWLVTFVMSVGMCFYLMSNVYVKWRTSPVIVTVSEQLVPAGKVPFPSVTICPQSKCNWNKYNYTSEYEHRKNDSLTLSRAIRYEDVSLVCKFGAGPALDRTEANVSQVETILEVAIRDFMKICVWRMVRVNCKDLFKMVLTQEGVCYNMNGLAASEMFRMDNIQQEYNYSLADQPSKGWSIDKGYSEFNVDSYPKRGRDTDGFRDVMVFQDSGGSVDLTILLVENFKMADKLCRSYNAGYKIYLQHPADMPQSSMYYYSILPSQMTALAMNMDILNTSKHLMHYPPETRQCYFRGDRPLRYFQIYTASNCRIECLSNFTYKMCGCVWFYMPHNDSSELCTLRDQGCSYRAEEKFANEELKLTSGIENEACQCLPSCDSVEYDAEVLKTSFNAKGALQILNQDGDYSEREFSKVQLYFKKARYVSMRRSELFGVTDFLANCGGLLGLFLGFSFLSLVEIFYYLTLRIGCILKKDLEDETAEKSAKTLKTK